MLDFPLTLRGTYARLTLAVVQSGVSSFVRDGIFPYDLGGGRLPAASLFFSKAFHLLRYLAICGYACTFASVVFALAGLVWICASPSDTLVIMLETIFPAVGLLFIGQVFIFLGSNREFE